MQLRVARFCLDCEELHTDNSCPRCASESYVFLSSWLKVDERRRWKRSGPPAGDGQGGSSITDTLSRWVKGQPGSEGPDHPTTRAADHVVHLEFGDAKEPAQDTTKAKPQPTRRLGKART